MNGLADAVVRLPAMSPSERVERSDLDLWQSPWMLGLIVVLLTAEWVLRKRLGML
jgi:hypothetical protein